jgi:hypothetical protein
VAPASAVSLSYSLAYGGSTIDAKREDDVFWANPFGRGFHGRNKIDHGLEYPAPQIFRSDDEEPKWGREFDPIGFSPMDGKHYARLQFAGTYDEHWKQNVAPNIPLDMKLDFWNTVPQDQVVNPPLEGGEIVRTIGLFPTSDGTRKFVLPNYNVFAVPIKGEYKDEGLPMPIDTVTIDLDTSHVTIRWAALCSQQKGYDEYEVVAIERKQADARDTSMKQNDERIPAGRSM